METHEEHSERHEEHKPHEFKIFIDAVAYTVTQTTMSGAQLKALAGKDAQYQLYLEEEGDRPDKPIADTESVTIREDMHFYAIPPATFGWNGDQGCSH